MCFGGLMTGRWRFLFASAAFVLIWMASGRVATAQKSSTPAERAHWVALTHKLESDPFDDDANSGAEDEMRRLIVVDDITIPICGTLFDELSDRKYKYGSEVARQYMLASASFVIEHPDAARDHDAMNRAGAESALKVYTAIVEQKPNEKSAKLDDLLKKQVHGTLADSLQKACSAAK
jgi:hypothetical protein